MRSTICEKYRGGILHSPQHKLTSQSAADCKVYNQYATAFVTFVVCRGEGLVVASLGDKLTNTTSSLKLSFSSPDGKRVKIVIIAYWCGVHCLQHFSSVVLFSHTNCALPTSLPDPPLQYNYIIHDTLTRYPWPDLPRAVNALLIFCATVHSVLRAADIMQADASCLRDDKPIWPVPPTAGGMTIEGCASRCFDDDACVSFERPVGFSKWVSIIIPPNRNYIILERFLTT